MENKEPIESIDKMLFFCDMCGDPFYSYRPRLVLSLIPENRKSEVACLCRECEEKILSMLNVWI